MSTLLYHVYMVYVRPKKWILVRKGRYEKLWARFGYYSRLEMIQLSIIAEYLYIYINRVHHDTRIFLRAKVIRSQKVR